jgi:hypothetical protein
MQQLRYSGPSSPRMANNCRCYISQIIGVRHFYVRSVASLGSRSVWCRACRNVEMEVVEVNIWICDFGLIEIKLDQGHLGMSDPLKLDF